MPNYEIIAKALRFINDKQRDQPSLEAIAAHVGISPFHLQRSFTDWAGVSPKKFLQYLSLERAKSILQNPNNSVYDAANKTGLSGTGRLHDLFVTIEGMTPGEYKNGGKNLTIYYSLNSCAFGNYLAAATEHGICTLFFYDTSNQQAEKDLEILWPQAKLIKKKIPVHTQIQKFFDRTLQKNEKIKLHLQGTPFQLKVWQALLTIPEGSLCSYGSLSNKVGKPAAQRAVGTAVGDNPVAFLIPCHRVIKSTGSIGNYRWRPERKRAMIGWEGMQTDTEQQTY